jgi:Mg2+-importing ATPase
LHADEKLFQTGWFVESLCTQVLVIFIIRTRGNPFKSRPHPVLVATSLGVALVGAVLPFTPVGSYFGLVPPPAMFYFILAGMALAYLVVVEIAKRAFYRWQAAGSASGNIQSLMISFLAVFSG